MLNLSRLYDVFRQCTGVTTDSRTCSPGSLFFALKGGNFDGNAFAAQALAAGCAYAVVDNAQCIPPGDTRYLLADDSLLALQQLARLHRRTLSTPLLGITGTNGKTTTKELIAAVLACRHRVLYTQGNLNNAIGVPLTLLRLRPEHDMAVIEMGASHPGDIRELVEIAEPDYGLITNVGKAHLAGFGSFEGVMKTKGELYDFLRTRLHSCIFIDGDNVFLKQMAVNLTQVSYGTHEGVYVQGRTVACSPYLAFDWRTEKETAWHRVQTQLIGDYNLPNTLAAVAVGLHFGVSPAQIDGALAAYVPNNHRSQLKQTADNTLIIDAYNANPTSMRAAIDNFKKMETGPKMLILGEMRELGEDSAAEHQRVVDHLVECGLTHVWLVGRQFAATRNAFRTFDDVTALVETLKHEKPVGKTILLKGSNGIHLDAAIDVL